MTTRPIPSSMAECVDELVALREKHETLRALAEKVISPSYGDMTGARKNLADELALYKEKSA